MNDNNIVFTDFKSDLFKFKLNEITKEKIAKYFDLYWIYKDGKWIQCEKIKVLNFITFLLIKYICDLFNSDIDILLEILSRWKQFDKNEIFEYLISQNLVDEKFLINNQIFPGNLIQNIIKESILEEKQNKEQFVKPEKSYKKVLTKYIETLKIFLDKTIINTDSVKDYIYFNDLHKMYQSWCLQNNYSSQDVRVFGKMLNALDYERTYGSEGRKIIKVKFLEKK